jgi:hypothetical protein
VAEWAGGDHGDTVLLTPGNHRMVDRTLFQMVENLFADWPTRSGDPPCLFKIAYVEVAHAPGEDLPLALELLEGRDGVHKRVFARASATGKNPAGRSSGEPASPRKQLSSRGERHFWEGLLRPGRFHCAFRQSLGDHLFGGARPIQFGSVDMGHTEARPWRNAEIAEARSRYHAPRPITATSRLVEPNG